MKDEVTEALYACLLVIIGVELVLFALSVVMMFVQTEHAGGWLGAALITGIWGFGLGAIAYFFKKEGMV